MPETPHCKKHEKSTPGCVMCDIEIALAKLGKSRGSGGPISSTYPSRIAPSERNTKKVPGL